MGPTHIRTLRYRTRTKACSGDVRRLLQVRARLQDDAHPRRHRFRINLVQSPQSRRARTRQRCRLLAGPLSRAGFCLPVRRATQGSGDGNLAASASALPHRPALDDVRRDAPPRKRSFRHDQSRPFITCGSSSRCACTSSGGVAANQVSREKSTKRSLLNVSRKRSVLGPLFPR